jgi:hypothetical protein
MKTRFSPRWVTPLAFWAAWTALLPGTCVAAEDAEAGSRVFRAGVSTVDITPQKLPVHSSGGFLAGQGSVIHDRLYARGMALCDGTTRLVLVVADTLFVPTELCDEVKAAASALTGIAAGNMLIAANHTHSAGCLVGCLGTETDDEYVAQVRPQLVACIEQAVARLQPAQIGWSSVRHAQDTHNRVFIRRPDCIGVDPFGERTIRVMMHPGYENPEFIGPSGPVDDELSLLCVRAPDGTPWGVLANYSMHYFGTAPISADYFGDFVRIFSQRVAGENAEFVAMMSNGTSGDLHWMDYSQPERKISRTQYAESVAAAAVRAFEAVEYHDWVPLRAAERRIRLQRRVPDERRWKWAQEILATMADGIPRNQQQVYAREAQYLREEPERELLLQALRIGDLGIAALPTETYALTGLKLKRRTPTRDLFTIELANGAEGYIPPPECLPLGGYNAWPARTAGLQVDAETIITDTVLELLEQLTGRDRRGSDPAQALYAQSVLQREPLAYWRMIDMDGNLARDISGHNRHGQLETGYLFYLDGPARDDLRTGEDQPRAIQFVGGRMKAALEDLGHDYTVELFFWNGLASDLRPVTGYLFSRGADAADRCPGDHLGIGGTWEGGKLQGRLFFFNGDERQEVLSGGPVIEPKTWNHVRLVRQESAVRVYLNFDPRPIISGTASVTRSGDCPDLFVGGRSDNYSNFEGRVAEVAVFRGAGDR